MVDQIEQYYGHYLRFLAVEDLMSIPIQSNFQTDLTPTFHDLSINWSYITNLWGNFTVLHLSASNILGLNQTFGYRYSEASNEQGWYDRVAIQPVTPNFFFVGLFVSIGKKDGFNVNEL